MRWNDTKQPLVVRRKFRMMQNNSRFIWMWKILDSPKTKTNYPEKCGRFFLSARYMLSSPCLCVSMQKFEWCTIHSYKVQRKRIIIHCIPLTLSYRRWYILTHLIDQNIDYHKLDSTHAHFSKFPPTISTLNKQWTWFHCRNLICINRK